MSDEHLELLRLLWERRVSRRRVLAGAGIGTLSALSLGNPALRAFAQSKATPTAPAAQPEPGFNLAAIGPLPVEDLKHYGIESIEYHLPSAFFNYTVYLSNKFPKDVASAIAASNPPLACLTSLVTPVNEDSSKTTRSIDALTIVAAEGAEAPWDGVFAAVSGGAPGDTGIGERNLVWTYDTVYKHANPQKPVKGIGMLFTRGRYAHLISIVDAAKTVTVADIAVVAKSVDVRLADAVAGKITYATRPVVPTLDYSSVVPTPAFPSALSITPSTRVTLRALDGQLLRLASESDQAFALAQGTDVKAAEDAVVVNYRAALDQKATILIAELNSESDRGRDPFIRAYLPEQSKKVANRHAGIGLTVEQYSFPSEGDPKAIRDALSQRFSDDIDHVYKKIPIENRARTSSLRPLADTRPPEQLLIDLINFAVYLADENSEDSSGGEEASLELVFELLEEILLDILIAGADRSAVVQLEQPLMLANAPKKVSRVQYFSLRLTSGDFATPVLSMDQIAGADAEELRSAMVEIAQHVLAGSSYQLTVPAPSTPVAPAPVLGDLTKVPFVGMPGMAPYPSGKLAKYLYGAQEAPTVAIPIGIQTWGDAAALLLPSPVADVVYNLPLSLAHVSSISAPTDDPYRQTSRRIRTQIYVDPSTATASWDAIIAAVEKPQKSPSTLGEGSAGWLQSDPQDPTASYQPFDGAAIFFHRGPFGVIVDIRDYSGKKPSLKDVAAIAKPIDVALKAAIAGTVAAGGPLGMPTFGPSESSSYLFNVQQIRTHGGAFIADRNDASDPDVLAASKKAYKLALSKKATVAISAEPVPTSTAAALFSGKADGVVPAGLSLSFLGELSVLADDKTATDFAGALTSRLKARYPKASIAALPSLGSGADETVFATVKQADASYPNSLVAQRTIGTLVAVAEFQVYASDRATVDLPTLAANTILLQQISSIADQIAKGSGYLFTVTPTS